MTPFPVSAYEPQQLLSQFHATSPALCEKLYGLIDPMPLEQWEEKVDGLQEWLVEHGHQECPFKYEHSFTKGVYYRQMSVRPYEVIMGMRYNIPHQCILLSGAMILFSNEGIIPMIGPCQFIGEAGNRKLALTVTDTVYANAFSNPTELRDADEIMVGLSMCENEAEREFVKKRVKTKGGKCLDG